MSFKMFLPLISLIISIISLVISSCFAAYYMGKQQGYEESIIDEEDVN